MDTEFRKELEHLLNRFSKEGGSNTPNFILADYLTGCLQCFDIAVARRENWYNVAKKERPFPEWMEP